MCGSYQHPNAHGAFCRPRFTIVASASGRRGHQEWGCKKKILDIPINERTLIVLLFSNSKSFFMSLVLHFKPSGFPLATYKEVLKQLEAAGAGSPKGRSYHVCYGDPNNVQVTDVWDSVEDFQAFGKTLVPIMQALGADPGQPEIQEVNNVIVGEVHAMA